ncbi:MAG: hypothetical protein NVSMB64_19970 [Candidatus Velthaea sp.]
MQTKHPETETPETYTYCGITAPLALWQEVGLKTINRVGGIIEFPGRIDYGGGSKYRAATDGDLIEARIRTGDTGEAALVWLIAERRRQYEEKEKNHAIWEQAQAQKKAGDDAIHAARIHRQAEELRCRAAGIGPNR